MKKAVILLLSLLLTMAMCACRKEIEDIARV